MRAKLYIYIFKNYNFKFLEENIFMKVEGQLYLP